jgi:outer membrane protein TolC
MVKKSFLVVASLLVYYGASAQVAFRSVEDVWAYADAHNITIKTATLEKDKARLASKQSYSALLPQVSATGMFTQNTKLPTTLIPAVIFGGAGDTYVPVQFGQEFIYFGGLTAQMDVLNMQNWFNVQIAKSTEAYNEANLSATRKAIYQEVATQFYGYLLMQEAERLAHRSEQIADSVFQSVSNRFNEGKVNKANVDIAQINLNRAAQTTITSQYQMRGARNNLKALLGIPFSDSLDIDAPLEFNTPVIATDFAPDPAITLAYQETRISLAQYKAGKSTFLPTLGLAYSNTTQKNANDFRPLSDNVQWYPAQYWSLRASWNIFNGGYRWYQVKRNKISYRESIAQYENEKNQSILRDENIRLSYQKASLLLEKTKQTMALSFDNYSIMTNRYNEGVETLENRLTAFSDYLTHQTLYLNSLADLLIQTYQIKIRQQSF